MSSYTVLIAYACAVGLAIWLLYSFEPRAWYWHAAGLAVAFALGFAPAPPGFDKPVMVVLTGFAIIFLLFWGLGGLLLRMSPQQHKHA